MDSQPAFDRRLIPPALIGIFSVIGICLVLLIYRYNTSQAVVEVTVTQTPFKYIYLGTEPAISTEPAPEESTTATLAHEPSPIFTLAPPIILTPNTPQTTPSTPVPTAIVQSNPTPSSAAPPPLNPGTYDDVYSGLIYSGNWNSTTIGTTLHVSDTLATPRNTVTFRFIGQQMILVYQPGPSLGVLQITLDSTQSQLDQSDTSGQRALAASSSGVHTVTITHVSGGSVNIDSIIIPTVVTPSPTATPTATP
jgi:hypothetical protein